MLLSPHSLTVLGKHAHTHTHTHTRARTHVLYAWLFSPVIITQHTYTLFVMGGANLLSESLHKCHVINKRICSLGTKTANSSRR